MAAAAAAKKKLPNHLWYLVPETVALFLFDDNVPIAIKEIWFKVILEADKGEEEDEKNQLKTYILRQNYFLPFKRLL